MRYGRVRFILEGNTSVGFSKMKFQAPQINLYVNNLEASRKFYERIGFIVSFTAKLRDIPVHYEMILDGFKLGIATKESAKQDHGLNPGENNGCELVLWTDDADNAVNFLLGNGAKLMSSSHIFLEGKLRVAWVRDLDGNPIQIVSKVVSQLSVFLLDCLMLNFWSGK